MAVQKKKITINQISCDIAYEVHRVADAKAPHLLLIHGGDSSMDEFKQLLPALGTSANVYLFDLPCCGQSSDVSAATVRARYGELQPALNYMRDVCFEFVRLVVEPHFSGRRALRVAGGSLGGNLALWLATEVSTWLKDVIVWSPGSAWLGDLFQVVGSSTALARAKQDWTGRRNELLEGVYRDNVVDVLGIKGLTRPQPWYWFSDTWDYKQGDKRYRPKFVTKNGDYTCSNKKYPAMSLAKATAISASFQETAESYKPERAVWHWQVSGEQLQFSHRERVTLSAGHDGPRIAELECHARFMAGKHDNHAPANLFEYTKELAQVAKRETKAKKLRVTWEAVENSGHSIHNERPGHLAKRLLGAIDA